MDVDEITQQFTTFFFAGTDTTATTSGTSLYYLGKHPEIQEELLEELRELKVDDEVDATVLPKLHRMTAFINEVLRLRNPAIAPMIRVVNTEHKV